MTDLQTPHSGPQPTGNPKADAKAAKAYAKASRKWYQKKRWWLAAAIIVIIGVSAASGGGDETEDAAVIGHAMLLALSGVVFGLAAAMLLAGPVVEALAEGYGVRLPVRGAARRSGRRRADRTGRA